MNMYDIDRLLTPPLILLINNGVLKHKDKQYDHIRPPYTGTSPFSLLY